MLAKCCRSEPGLSRETVQVSEIPFLVMPMHAKAITSCMRICPKDRGPGLARGRRYSVWALVAT